MNQRQCIKPASLEEEKGKAVNLSITPMPDGTFSCKHAGTNTEVNRFSTALSHKA